jgi:hypothetical protein
VACIIKEDGNRERPAQRHIGPNENNKTIIIEEGQPSFHIEPNQQKKNEKNRAGPIHLKPIKLITENQI